MAEYTIFNLREAEDMAAKHGYGDAQEARFPWRDLDAETTGVSLIRIKPGMRQPFAHRHDQAEEIYVVLRGSGRAALGEDIQEIEEMDAIRIEPSVVRSLAAGEEGLEILAFGPHHEDDAEMVEGDVWSD
jgi:mannose-6-phosphate isomerase-like protein (cupin superfamily)